MQILSALDAISPAFSRTKLVLFSPFRKGRSWKLAATGYLAAAGTAFIPWPLIYLLAIPVIRQQANLAAGLAHSIVTFLIGLCVIVTIVYLLLFYVFSRLRFAFFDVVLNNGQFVAPAWRKYGGASLKWTLFKLLLGSVFTAVIALPVVHIAKGVIGTFQSLNLVPGDPPSPEFTRAIFSVYAAFFVVYIFVGLFMWVNSVLADFVIPSLALEDTSLAEAFRRFGVFVRNEPGQFALYAVLKLALAFAAFMAAGIAFYILMLVVVLAALIVVGVIGLILYAVHVPTAVLTALAIVAGVGLYLFVIFYGVFLAYGTVVTFLESYLLYFLGGRYPLLGERLTASTPPPARVSPLYPNRYPAFTPPPPTAPLPPGQ
jgi:hypothetical protein